MVDTCASICYKPNSETENVTAMNLYEVTCGSRKTNLSIVIFSKKEFYKDHSGVVAFKSASLVSLAVYVDGGVCFD